MGRQRDCQSSCHSTGFVIISYPTCGLYTFVQHEPWHMTEKAEFIHSPTVETLTSPAWTPLSASLRNCAYRGRIVFMDESFVPNCILTTTADVSWDVRGSVCGEGPSLTIASHIGSQQGIIVWGVISFYNRYHQLVISGTVTQFCDDDILFSVLLLFRLQHPEFNFTHDNARILGTYCYELS